MAAFGEFSGSMLVSDASVLINFLRIDRMDLIAAVSYEFMATDHVADEISDIYPEQQVRYQAALDRGAVAQVSLTDLDELELFAMLAASGRLGKGGVFRIQHSLQQILRLLQINLFERRDLFELLRGDPPQPGISPNQTALLFS